MFINIFNLPFYLISFTVIGLWLFYFRLDFPILWLRPGFFFFNIYAKFLFDQIYNRLNFTLILALITAKNGQIVTNTRCLKSVRIRSFSGPYFPIFGLNTERYCASFRIQSECGKIQTRKTPNTGTSHVVTPLQLCNIFI